MVRQLTLILAVATIAAAAGAQNSQYIYFSTRFAETAASGRGGHINDLAAPTHPLVMGFGYVNEAAVLNTPGLAVVRPGVPNMTPISTSVLDAADCSPPPMVVDFMEISEHPATRPRGRRHRQRRPLQRHDQRLEHRNADELRGHRRRVGPVPARGPRREPARGVLLGVPRLAGNALGYRGTRDHRGRRVPAPGGAEPLPAPSTPQPPIFFLRQAHLETFFGMAPGTGAAIDTDGFCVDQSNGDIYISFDGASGTNALPFTGTFLSAPATLIDRAGPRRRHLPDPRERVHAVGPVRHRHQSAAEPHPAHLHRRPTSRRW